VPLILLTAKKVPAGSAAEFYELIKKNPGKYFMGSSGNGSIDHLTAMDIAGRKGLSFTHVPYKGNGPALTDLAAGNVDFMYSGSFNSARPFLERGDVTALAVTSAKRSVALPDVVTLDESVDGLKGFSGGTWQALLAPKGTPEAVKAVMNKAVQAALQDKEVLESLTFQGATVMDMTPAQCQNFIGSEYDRWSSKIKELGLTQGK
jgi:tripartite-type tricarboxylate transporter receptor subunit TctC